MVERFADAALRHLETAEVLENEGRTEDAAYHYGLVGEMALKAATVRVLGVPFPRKLRSHINHQTKPLQALIAGHEQLDTLMKAGRLGGALGRDLSLGLLGHRFVGWSLDIRYADDNYCPVNTSDLAVWKADAVDLYNNGVF